MGYQIIKQPDDRYCVWSSVVDSIILYNCTAKELEDYFAEKAAENSRDHTRRMILKVEALSHPYHQFTMTVQEALERDRSKDHPQLCERCKAVFFVDDEPECPHNSQKA